MTWLELIRTGPNFTVSLRLDRKLQIGGICDLVTPVRERWSKVWSQHKAPKFHLYMWDSCGYVGKKVHCPTYSMIKTSLHSWYWSILSNFWRQDFSPYPYRSALRPVTCPRGKYNDDGKNWWHTFWVEEILRVSVLVAHLFVLMLFQGNLILNYV